MSDVIANQNLPYSGLRVVEMTHMVMGPTCGMVLADLGAEVIKVEPIAGDSTRALRGSGAGFFSTFNRNKKSIAVDGFPTRNGRSRPRLCRAVQTQSASGLRIAQGFFAWPLRSSHRARRGRADDGGVAYMTGPDGRPLRAGTSVNDIMGGMFGAIGAMAALAQRERTGRGQEVQSALFENNVFLVAQHMMQYAVTGNAAAPMPSRISAWAVYDVFSVKNGEQIFLAVASATHSGSRISRPTSGSSPTISACRSANGCCRNSASIWKRSQPLKSAKFSSVADFRMRRSRNRRTCSMIRTCWQPADLPR